jgi:molybdopterin biosynthesis enzyme
MKYLGAGADAVVMVELTENVAAGGDGVPRVIIKEAVKPGDDIRPIGCDIQYALIRLPELSDS